MNTNYSGIKHMKLIRNQEQKVY